MELIDIDTTKLNINNLEKNIGLNIDPTGFVFNYEGRFFRAINNSAKKDVLFLFESGAIEELYNNHLIPKTSISELTVEGYDLILEHEKIDIVIYPTEWSFSMLKDAALLVLKVNKILLKYGFETRDSHGYNVLFNHGVTTYIDIGSFGRKYSKKYWSGLDNFKEFYFYTLFMWSKGNPALARYLLINDGKYVNAKDYEFNNYRFTMTRILPQQLLAKYFYYLRGLRNLQKLDIKIIRIVKKEKLKRRVLKILMVFSKLGLIPNNHVNLNRLERRIIKIKNPTNPTEWGEYHSNLSGEGLFDIDSRFGIIIEYIKKYNIQEVLEIAGNQGLLAEEISKYAKTVICSDIDEIAVDNMYRRVKRNKFKIYPVLLDFLSPVYLSLYYSESYSVYKRYKSEAVIALALTHHLILTRKTPLNNIIEALSFYTKKYLFTEFMPEGLKSGQVPGWYNIDWFREHFIRYFNLLVETPSEKDGSRILFIGEKKASDNDSKSD